MNGRIYDYNVGRFMSVDPVIQSPTNTQSVNPYSYIMNNPMSGTDPTGYTSCPQGQECAQGIKVEDEKVVTTGSRIARKTGGKVVSGTIVDKDGTSHSFKATVSNGSFTGSINSTAANGSTVNTQISGRMVDAVGQRQVNASNVSTNQKYLTSASVQKTKFSTSKYKKSAQKSLEELRNNPEFAELEKKYGTLSLTFNNDEKTGLTGNTININDSIFGLEYEVDVGGSVDAYMGTLSDRYV